jgi:hypothetical protein
VTLQDAATEAAAEPLSLASGQSRIRLPHIRRHGVSNKQGFIREFRNIKESVALITSAVSAKPQPGYW